MPWGQPPNANREVYVRCGFKDAESDGLGLANDLIRAAVTNQSFTRREQES